jgi:hypothetical protein
MVHHLGKVPRAHTSRQALCLRSVTAPSLKGRPHTLQIITLGKAIRALSDRTGCGVATSCRPTGRLGYVKQHPGNVQLPNNKIEPGLTEPCTIIIKVEAKVPSSLIVFQNVSRALVSAARAQGTSTATLSAACWGLAEFVVGRFGT